MQKPTEKRNRRKTLCFVLLSFALTLAAPIAPARADYTLAKAPRVFLGDFSQAAILLLHEEDVPWHFSKPAASAVSCAYPDGEGGLFFALDPAPQRLYHWSLGEAQATLVAVNDGLETKESQYVMGLWLPTGYAWSAYSPGKRLFEQDGALYLSSEGKTRRLPTPAFPTLDAYFFISEEMVAVVCRERGISILNTSIEPSQPLAQCWNFSNWSFYFELANPDVEVTTVIHPEEVDPAIWASEIPMRELMKRFPDSFDIVQTNRDDAIALYRLGLLADLSSYEPLREASSKWHPSFRSALSFGPYLAGVPLSVDDYWPWWLDESRWQGYELGKPPETLAELFESMDLCTEKIAQGKLINSPIGRDAFVDVIGCAMRTQYVLTYWDASRPLSFDTPVFRNMLSQWRRVLLEWNAALQSEIRSTHPDYYPNSGYPALIALGPHRILNDNAFLPPALEPGKSAKVWADLSVVAIPARAKNKAQSVRFLNFIERNRTPYESLFVEPVEESEIAYPQVLAEIAGLTLQKEQIQSAQGEIDQRLVSSRIKQLDAQMAEVEPNRVWVSRIALQKYEEKIAPALTFPSIDNAFLCLTDWLGDDQIIQIINDYTRYGRCDLDETIKTLDALAVEVWLRENDRR